MPTIGRLPEKDTCAYTLQLPVEFAFLRAVKSPRKPSKNVSGDIVCEAKQCGFSDSLQGHEEGKTCRHQRYLNLHKTLSLGSLTLSLVCLDLTIKAKLQGVCCHMHDKGEVS